MTDPRRGAWWFFEFMERSGFKGRWTAGHDEGPAGDVYHITLSYTLDGESRLLLIHPDVRNGMPVLVITEDPRG